MEAQDSKRGRRGRLAIVAMLVLGSALVFAAGASAHPILVAAGDPGQGLAKLLKGWGTEIYGGAVAVISIMFLLKREIKALMIFLGSALLVGWMVLSPDSVASAGRSLAQKIFGG